MSTNGTKSLNFSTNSLFPAFSLGLIGWGVLHIWGLGIKTGIHFHVLAALPGFCLSSLVLYRYRQHWPVNPGVAGGRKRLSLDYHSIASCLLLAAAGFSIGFITSGGSFFLLVLMCIGMISIPWTRLAFCRSHFFFSSALVAGGALLGLVVLGRSAHPFHYPMAAWLLLAVACALVVFVIVTHGNRAERMPVSGY